MLVYQRVATNLNWWVDPGFLVAINEVWSNPAPQKFWASRANTITVRRIFANQTSVGVNLGVVGHLQADRNKWS